MSGEDRHRDVLTEDDHARGCQGREYLCTCGYDDRVAAELERLRNLMREIINRCDRWNENGADRGVDHAVMLAKQGLGISNGE